jgi:molybdate transport system permease protein
MNDENKSAATARTSASPPARHRVWPDWPFFVMLSIIGSVYVLLLVGMLAGNFGHLAMTPADGEPENVAARAVVRIASPIIAALKSPEIQFAIKLTLASCFFSAILSVIVAVPLGYLISRFRFPGRNLLDALLDVPIVLPPLVVGLSLLMLFQLPQMLGLSNLDVVSDWFVFQVPGVVLAQFMVAAAFAIRTMRATFDQIDIRAEQVALTLGCTRAQAFTRVTFPLARQGMLTAGMMAWARSMGEFGPLLIFAGATRNKTEVLSTTVFLELSIGDLNAAVAVSLLMVFAAVAVLIVARTWGSRAMSL